MRTQIFIRTLFALAIFTFSCSKYNAQTFVKPSEISTANIANYLKSKNFEITEQTADYLKIKKIGLARYMYLDLKNSNRYIFFNIAYKLADHVEKEKLDAFLKKANSYDVIKVRSFEKGDDIQIEYFFWIKQGFSYESLQDAIEEFFLYEADCINADTEKILQ